MRIRETYVYIHLAEGPVPAGRLEMIEDGRNSHATFQYGDRYLGRPNRVAVDPAALPLPQVGSAPWTFRTAPDFQLFNGIRDTSPDGWGRYVMDKVSKTPLDEFDYLVATGEHRVGALAFGPDPVNGPKRMAAWADNGDVGDYLDLEELANAAQEVQDVDRLDPKLQRFLIAGSSLGGARPKAATDMDGRPWIAKFPAKDDLYPVCRVEYAAMRLATSCGLDVPRIELKTIMGRDVYLIERFDRVVRGGDLARIPYASALTMLEALEMAAHTYAYRDLAEAIRKYGSNPKADMRELYRRMAFNILVGNDDDHLRNHAFLFDGSGWRLSPLYDVVPRPRAGMEASLILAVGEEGKLATLANALSAASTFGLNPDEARAILNDLQAQVARLWRDVFIGAGISRGDVERFANSFVQTTRPLDN